MTNIPESDWKYLSKIKDELIDTLCKRINDEASRIANDPAFSQHEKFLRLFRHVVDSNEIVANCFDDWRRSNIVLKMLCIQRERLLTRKQILQLSEATQDRISQLLTLSTL